MSEESTFKASLMKRLNRGRVWQASWIWDDTKGSQRNRFVLFRTSIEPPAATAALQLHISADTRYRVWVDGRFVGRGPVQSQPYHQFYDSYDLPQAEGDRIEIAVEVYHVGMLPHALGGLIAEIEADGEVLSATGDNWLCMPGLAWQQETLHFDMNRVHPYQEHFDAQRLAPTWTTCRCDELSYPWRPATSHKGDEDNHEPTGLPWTALRPRPIPYMESETVCAQSIVEIAEQQQIITRTRPGDISVSLSAATRPIEKTVVENAESLLALGAESFCRVESYHAPKSKQPGEAFIPSMILDFGQVVTAFPVIKLKSAAECEIRMGYAERLIDGAFNNAMECQFADSYITREGYQEWEPSYWRAFRYLKIQFFGKQGPLKVDLHELSARRTFYPFEYAGNFNSDDAELNELFSICRETTHLCAHEGIMDTPFREGAQWLGDVAAVTLPSIYACFGDTVLAEKFLLQSAATQRTTGLLANISNAASDDYSWDIPDYSLWWIEGLWQHYLFSGDENLLRQLYPVVTKLVQSHLTWINAQGLVEDPPGWVFIDWADINRNGISSAYNAIFYLVLGRVEAIALRLKDDAFAELAHELKLVLKANFETLFWNTEAGLYDDSYGNGCGSKCFSEQANVLAVLAGLCPLERRSELLERVLVNPPDHLTEAQPFCSAFTLQACRQNERMDLAFGIIKSRWIERFVRHGETSTPEEWSYRGSWRKGDRFHPVMRTRSHAWSAAPAAFLIRELTGIKVLEPGMRHLSVDPLKTEFSYQITVPTPCGSLSITWDQKTLEVDAPSGVSLKA